LFSKNLKEIKTSVRVGHAAAQELHVGEVLVGVWVEEALGVVRGVGEDLVHLLVKVAALVGSFHGQAVAVHGVDDAAGGDLGLEQADAVLLDDELLLPALEAGPHGLIDAHLLHLLGVGLGGHHHAGDAARAVQVALDGGHFRHLLHRLGALDQVVQRLLVDDARVQQVGGGHLPPEARELDLAAALHGLL
ncbi:hypothetical protein N331_09152, partial [Merops nubicus]